MAFTELPDPADDIYQAEERMSGCGCDPLCADCREAQRVLDNAIREQDRREAQRVRDREQQRMERLYIADDWDDFGPW